MDYPIPCPAAQDALTGWVVDVLATDGYGELSRVCYTWSSASSVEPDLVSYMVYEMPALQLLYLN